MQNLQELLHDIEGIDAISVWPLAWGYWVLITLAVSFLVALALLGWRRYRFNRSWKRDTLNKLAELEKKLSSATALDTMVFFSEYLRRIALERYPREECAGLMGKDWLKWLSAKDAQFNWEEKGGLLMNIPYMKHARELPLEQIRELIQAAKGWVK